MIRLNEALLTETMKVTMIQICHSKGCKYYGQFSQQFTQHYLMLWCWHFSLIHHKLTDLCSWKLDVPLLMRLSAVLGNNDYRVTTFRKISCLIVEKYGFVVEYTAAVRLRQCALLFRRCQYETRRQFLTTDKKFPRLLHTSSYITPASRHIGTGWYWFLRSTQLSWSHTTLPSK